MIKHLELINYRSHEHTSFDLEPMTVFIGPTAGGKSNLFKGLLLLQTAVTRAPQEVFGDGPWGIQAQRYRGNQDAPIGFNVRVSELGEEFQGEEARYLLQLDEGPEGVFIAEERLDRFRSPGAAETEETVFHRGQARERFGEFGAFAATDSAIVGVSRSRPEDPSEEVRFAGAVGRQLSRYGQFHLELSQLRRTSPANGHPQRIGYNGRNLPGALWSLREDPTTGRHFEKIVQEMKALLPDLEDLLLVPAGRENTTLGFKHRHRTFQAFLTAAEEADGVLLTLGLLAVLYQPEPPTILALEEPEAGLHPGRLRWLVDRLWDLSHGRLAAHSVQVLISTDSPYLLDWFVDVPEAVRVVTKDKGTTEVISLLDAVGQYGITQKELAELPLGEQWYAGLFEGPRVCG